MFRAEGSSLYGEVPCLGRFLYIEVQVEQIWTFSGQKGSSPCSEVPCLGRFPYSEVQNNMGNAHMDPHPRPPWTDTTESICWRTVIGPKKLAYYPIYRLEMMWYFTCHCTIPFPACICQRAVYLSPVLLATSLFLILVCAAGILGHLCTQLRLKITIWNTRVK